MSENPSKSCPATSPTTGARLTSPLPSSRSSSFVMPAVSGEQRLSNFLL